MKFPLSQRPFPPLHLTPQQGDEYEKTAMAVLLETVAEYEHYVHKQNRAMNKKRWKAVKTRENVTVYKKRHMDDHADAAAWASSGRAKAESTASALSSNSSTGSGSASAIMDWSLPKLLAVGTIVGNFDDVMYGVISPDSDCVKVKTTYVDDELVDGQILNHIRHATMEDPYKFLGIKWFVKAHPASVNAVLWPRDLVFIEGTGTHIQPNGDKIGYHLMHSVEIPQCHDLSHLGILRGAFSSCFLFKQLQNGTVEVYMKSFVEPAGNVPDMIAVMSAANGLIGCWKSVWCAQNKKLAWLVRDAAAAARQRQREHGEYGVAQHLMKTNAKGKACCALCDSSFSSFRTAVACELCHEIVCSRCKTARKLTYVYGGTEVKKIPTAFCKNCITRANNLNSAEVARYEYVPGALEARWQTTAATPAAAMLPRSRNQSYETQMKGSHSTTSLSGTESSSVPATWSADNSIDEGTLMVADVDVDTIDDWENRNQIPHESAIVQVVTREASPVVNPQQQLWMQMNELRRQAEQAYRIAQQNNRAMYETTGQRS